MRIAHVGSKQTASGIDSYTLGIQCSVSWNSQRLLWSGSPHPNALCLSRVDPTVFNSQKNLTCTGLN